MPKIDYKMMRDIQHECMWVPSDFQRFFNYTSNKRRRLLKILGKQAKETQECIFLNICNRSYTGPPIYQPKTLKEMLG